jgi:hypothetical protein
LQATGNHAPGFLSKAFESTPVFIANKQNIGASHVLDCPAVNGVEISTNAQTASLATVPSSRCYNLFRGLSEAESYLGRYCPRSSSCSLQSLRNEVLSLARRTQLPIDIEDRQSLSHCVCIRQMRLATQFIRKSDDRGLEASRFGQVQRLRDRKM